MIATLIRKNQLPYARVLCSSWQQHHPGERMLALLVDEAAGFFDPQGEPFDLLTAKELPVADFPALSFRFGADELREVLKPYFLEYLLGERGFDRVLLLEAETRIYNPLDKLFSLLNSHSMLLIPAYLHNYPTEPDMDCIFHSGVIGVSRRPETLDFLQWWQTHPRLDMAPALVKDLHIYRRPGEIVGHWNLDPQRFSTNALLIFHHGGFQVENIEGISNLQDRYTLADMPGLRPLLEDYRQDLLNKGYNICQSWPYHYNSFSNGAPVAPVFRRIWARTKGYAFHWPAPHRADNPDSFFNWLKEPVQIPAVKPGGSSPAGNDQIIINNFALELYRIECDCQQQFPDPFGIDRAAFVRWFVAWCKEEKIAPLFYEAVEQSLDRQRRPLLSAYRRLNRYFANWVYTLYREEKPLYHIYLKLNRLLEKAGISQFFEDVVSGLFSEHNLLPLSIDRQRREEIIRQPEPGVNVIGFLFDESGLGRVTRDIIRVFIKNELPVAQINLGGVPGRLSDYPELSPTSSNPHAIQIFYLGGMNQYIYRLLGEDKLRHRYNIGYLWWELNRVPPILMDNLRIFNEVWVGSDFLKEVLEPVLSAPVYRMPIIIPRPAPVSLTRQDLGLPDNNHIFLFIFDPYSNAERKNPLGVIEAYRRAFFPHFGDTLLVLKTKNLEQFPAFGREIRAAVKSVGGVLINRLAGRAEVDALLAACDTYVSLHRVEGYGATLAEAMLHHKPVIATAYSGNMDFMTPNNSYPVSYTLVDVKKGSSAYTAGARWADPNLDEAAGLMKHIIRHPEEARRKGLRAGADIEKSYSQEAFSRAILERLDRIRVHLR